MSAIYLDNRLLHYEIFGRRGPPIIFLHSWVGSWRYWVPIMDVVAEHYRAYAIDFWGFGDSDRNHGTFTIPEYAEMLRAFMDNIGMQQANLVGHGLGGMVAIRAAQQYPDRFQRLMTVCAPLQGQILKDVTKPGAISRLMGRNNLITVWSKLIRQVPVDDSDVQQELYEDTESLNEHVVQRVQDSIMATDLLPTISSLNHIPLLAVYGEKDSIVPPGHAQVLNGEHGRPHQLLVLPHAHHFPFLEKSNTFHRLVLDFMKSEGGPVELKEQWRRRVSQREYL